MTTIEQRHEGCGYVYTKKTRMGFSPKFTVTRKFEHRTSTDIVVWAALGHTEPVQSDITEVVTELSKLYPDRRILADTDTGLVPVYDPRPPTAADLSTAATI